MEGWILYMGWAPSPPLLSFWPHQQEDSQFLGQGSRVERWKLARPSSCLARIYIYLFKRENPLGHALGMLNELGPEILVC